MRIYYRIITSIVLLMLINYAAQAQCPTLVWSDEFDGTELDLTKWEPQIGDGCAEGICGWGNNELQYYKAENAVVSNGTLKIIAKKERVQSKAYTSARIRTKGLADFTFGRFEARIKLLHGQGLWPAFWMLSTNEPYGGWPQSGEIDIMELLGQNPEEILGTIHYGDPYPDNQHQGTDFKLYNSSFDQDFHVFAIEWEPGVIRWYVDDILYQTKTSDDVLPYNWPFDAGNQMHFLLNVAVGGNLPGSPDATTPFPSQMEVDYVRVYDSGFNPSISGDRLVPYQSAGEVYTINNAASNSTFSWTVPAGATIASGAGTSSINVNWGDTGGDVICDVTTDCITKQYKIGVTVEPNYLYEFSFENFDEAANVTLNATTGTFTEINNPDPSGVNTSAISAEYIRNSQEQYDVISYATSAISDADLYSNRNKKFYMDILTQAPVGTEVIIQLENSTAASATNYPTGRHSRYVGTITQNGTWERVAFDFLDQPDGSTSPTGVDQIIILFNSNSLTGDTYHWDNFNSYKADDGTGTTNSPPTASYTHTATNLAVDFDGSGSSDPDGTISSWNWDLGDGNTATGALISHTYGAAGDYSVTLMVTDDGGATDSYTEVVSVTDGSTGGDPVSMHVQSIVTGTESLNKGAKRGTATVTIHNDLENPVDQATVTGTFSGTFNETVSGVTGADGTVTFATTGTSKGGVTVDFCVDDVTHATLTYNVSSNDITCTGTSARTTSTGLSEVTDFQLAIYPNPARETLNIAMVNENTGDLDLKLFNMAGQIVQTHVKQLNAGQQIITLDLSQLGNGIYYLSGQINGKAINRKIYKE
ncbi:MAG: family 16 glycosylhydrolase [Candidatus Cyclobacteriaceae bacterium M2_1C_046]